MKGRFLCCTLRPKFTKDVCRQTEVYVRHMTRFLQTWFVKNKRRFVETKGGLTSFVNSGLNVCLGIIQFSEKEELQHF